MAAPVKPDFPEPRRFSIGSRLRSQYAWCWSKRTRETKRLVIATTMSIGLGAGAATACIWRPDVLAALTLIPAWCWFVGGLLATTLAWQARNRRFACGLALLWFAFAIGWVEDLHSIVRVVTIRSDSEVNPGKRPLRIVSLNCANDEQCIFDLQRVNPDVVLLQEAPGDDGLAKMTARLFGDEGRFLAGGDTAILARATIQRKFVDRSAPFVTGTVLFDDGRTFSCVSLRLAPPPSRLDFWNADFWLDHQRTRNLHRHQLRQIMAQVHRMSSTSGILVGGDFNTSPLDRALDELRPNLSDAFDRRGIGWGATGTNDWPLFRVDQIWSSPELIPIRATTEKTNHSDHRLVVCDAILRQQ